MLALKGILERKENEIIGIASTETPDRDGEVILQSGWDTTNFLKNPVLLALHDYNSFPIGTVTELSVNEGKLYFKAVFSEATQQAREAYALVKEGVLRTFSVGFIAREWQDNNVISKMELLEISLVPVPANADAVVLAKGLGSKGNGLAKMFSDDWLKEKEIAEQVQEKLTEEVEVKEGSVIECECGKTYTLKFTTQEVEAPADASKEGEDGEGRKDEVEDQKAALIKEALKSLQKVREIENRKEDRL